MTIQEVRALIDAKIKGQGTNVDAGSVLPAILNGILDLIDGGGGGTSDAVQYIPQELTAPQQMQARKNQGLYYSEGGGGNTVLDWDGNTEGKDFFADGNLYKVSTDTPQAEQLKSFVLHDTQSSESMTINIGDADITSLDGLYIVAVTNPSLGAVILVCLASEVTMGGYTFTQGIWLWKTNSGYTSQLVYEATETIHHIDPKYIKDMYYSEGEDEEKTVQLTFVPSPSDWRETLIILDGGSLGYARYSTDIPNIDDWVQIVVQENIIPAQQLTFQQESGYYTISEGSGDYQIIVVQAEGITIPDIGSPTTTGIYVLSRLYGGEPVTGIESMLDSMTYNIKATVHQIPAKYIPSSGLDTFEIEFSALNPQQLGEAELPNYTYEQIVDAVASGKLLVLTLKHDGMSENNVFGRYIGGQISRMLDPESDYGRECVRFPAAYSYLDQTIQGKFNSTIVKDIVIYNDWPIAADEPTLMITVEDSFSV